MTVSYNSVRKGPYIMKRVREEVCIEMLQLKKKDFPKSLMIGLPICNVTQRESTDDSIK